MSTAGKFVGCVKWFNLKTGFGFLTVVGGSDGDESRTVPVKVGSEMFVHHTNVRVKDEQYRYLVQGEYVEFSVSEVSNGQHSYQAIDVTGMCSGKLTCETRHESRLQSGGGKRGDGDGDGDGGDDDADYTPVVRRKSAAPASAESRPFTRTRGGGGGGGRGRSNETGSGSGSGR